MGQSSAGLKEAGRKTICALSGRCSERKMPLQILNGRLELIAKDAGVRKHFHDFDLAGRYIRRLRRFEYVILLALGPNTGGLRIADQP
jgi:hypothetical protein